VNERGSDGDTTKVSERSSGYDSAFPPAPIVAISAGQVDVDLELAATTMSGVSVRSISFPPIALRPVHGIGRVAFAVTTVPAS